MIQPAPGPLSDASVRLRRKPGRPRKNELRGDTSGPTSLDAPPTLALPEAVSAPFAAGAVTPRLFGLDEAAAYLSVSKWTVRAWVDGGHLRKVTLPGKSGDNRRVLVDRLDLDAFVERWKRA